MLAAEVGVLPEEAVEGDRVLFTSQEDQTGRVVPCAVINATEAPPSVHGSHQEKRRLLISIMSASGRQQEADADPGDLHADNVDAIISPLRQHMLAKDLAPAITAAVAAAGLANFTCLFARYVGPIETEPVDKCFVETFAWDVVCIEADC